MTSRDRWRRLPDEGDGRPAASVELHEERHRPEVVGLVVLLRARSQQRVLRRQRVNVRAAGGAGG